MRINIISKIIITVFILSLTCNLGFSQGPKSPEASSFEPIDSADMVNLLTGDFTYVLPLINIPSPEGGYPLTLSYNAGIAMNQEASWAGLGWNVNPGAINRSVSGVPDDWKNVKKHRTIYDVGGVNTSYSGSIGFGYDGVISIGVYASYSENKTFGGENSYGFNIGGSLGVAGVINGSIGTDSASFGVNVPFGQKSGYNRGIGIGVSRNFDQGRTSVNLSVDGSQSFYPGGSSNGAVPSHGASIGLSFSSKGVFLNSENGSANLTQGDGVPPSVSFKNDGFIIPLPVLNFSYQRSRYWTFDTDYSIYNGSLYAGNMRDLLDENVFDWKVNFDNYEATYSHSKANQIMDTNFNFTSYDTYSVTGQGVSGSIAPKIFEEGTLFLQEETFTSPPEGYFRGSNSSYYYPENNNSGDFNNSIENNKMHFYFTNVNSSYLKINSGDWNSPATSGNHNNPFYFDTTNKNIESTVTIDNESYTGYNSSQNRLRTGAFIQVFTNDQIIQQLQGSNSINFIEADGINRNQNNFPLDGIGGYRITTIDGKIYHYSLPVYQKEKFSRSAKIDEDINNDFYESSELYPYATHWLLTAITGPDYVDVNSNNQLDEDDYGYWIEFEYGKWSDGYSWRTPVISGFEKNKTSKTYSWGIKEIYYLDKIKSKTHTALFVKSLRDDNLSSPIDVRNGNNPIKYETNHIQSFVTGDDGNLYIKGVYDRVALPSNNQFSFAQSEHEIYVKTNSHKSLKLDKIILLKNRDAEVVQKFNSNQLNPILAGEIYIDENYYVYNINSQLLDNYSKNVHSSSWYGQFFDKVLDLEDIEINNPNIEDLALKVIEFNHDYRLMPNSLNSINPSGAGKLSLNSVSFNGKSGVQLIPPYLFDYANPFTPYNNEAKDDWGYSNIFSSWSLNKITTPLGEELIIDYEEDKFYQEAAISEFVFDENLEVKFTGQDPGNKWVTVRNHRDNIVEQDIDFTEYYQLGQQSRVNINYIWDPSSNAGERVADVDKVCTVTSVTNNSVTFQLPSNSIGNFERSQEICHAEDWQFYRWYSDPGNEESVVQRTSNFLEEYRANDCDEVRNGNHRLKIQIYSNKKTYNNFGGGLRVQKLTIKKENDEEFSTNYSYNVPNSSNSSGITTYEPSTQNKEIKYISEQIPPSVMYEYVTVSNSDINQNIISKDIYHFDVLKPMVLFNGGFEYEGFIRLDKTQASNYSNVLINNENSSLKLSKYNLINNYSSLGRLLSKETFNGSNQLISRTINEYFSNSEINQGITQESFKSYKRVRSAFFDPKYLFSSSSKVYYPSIIKNVTTISGNSSSVVNYDKLDFFTGEFIETSYLDSEGVYFKNQVIPAYKKYPDMQLKVDNSNNRNMLSQKAVEYKFLKDGMEWKPIGVGITTWNNNWNYIAKNGVVSSPTSPEYKIWRKHKSFIWDGNIDSQGKFIDYDVVTDDGFNWGIDTNPNPNNDIPQPTVWKEISEINYYNHYSIPLEIEDVNGSKAATKMWENDSKIVVTGNAGYSEIFYSSAENIELENGTYYIGQGIEATGEHHHDEKSHTGIYSKRVYTGGHAFTTTLQTNQHRAGKYKLSVWVDIDNHTNARIVHNGNQAVPFEGEKVVAGNWVQLNHYLDISVGNEELYLTSANGDIYFDDFRLHPIESSITSYVYNEYDELTFILGANNMATKYQYDAAGRLIRVFQETANTPTIQGGFKRAKEYRYNYKREIESNNNGNGNPTPITGDINVGQSEFISGCTPNENWSCFPNSPCKRILVSINNVIGGSGNYTEFKWQYKLQNHSAYTTFETNQTTSAYFEYRSDITFWCDEQGTATDNLNFRCIITDSDNNQAVINYSSSAPIACNCTYSEF